MRITYKYIGQIKTSSSVDRSFVCCSESFDRHMEPHNSRIAKIRGARFAPPMGAMPHPTLITEIPFDFSQKYQTGPRPNRRRAYCVFWNAIDLCRIYTSKKNLNMGPVNRPAFCRQVPLFYAKCPSKNINGIQVGRSAMNRPTHSFSRKLRGSRIPV